MKKTISIILLFSLILINSACNKDRSILYTGHVKICLETGERTASFENIKVQVKGTEISTLTDKDGKFEILVPVVSDTNFYSIIFSKTGFATREQIIFNMGKEFRNLDLRGSYDTIFIAEKSTLEIFLSDTSENYYSPLRLYSNFSNTKGNFEVNYYMSIFPDVSMNDSLIDQKQYVGNTEEDHMNLNNFSSEYPGQTLYFIAYGKAYTHIYQYDERYLYQYYDSYDLSSTTEPHSIYPTLGESSNIISYQIP